MRERVSCLGVFLASLVCLGACGDPGGGSFTPDTGSDANRTDGSGDAARMDGGGADGTVADGARPDSTVADSTLVDTARPDTVVVDTARPDTVTPPPDTMTGGMCVSSCTMNSECQSSCPAATGSVWCCSTTVRMCYQNVGTACDITPPPTDGGGSETGGGGSDAGGGGGG